MAGKWCNYDKASMAMFLVGPCALFKDSLIMNIGGWSIILDTALLNCD